MRLEPLGYWRSLALAGRSFLEGQVRSFRVGCSLHFFHSFGQVLNGHSFETDRKKFLKKKRIKKLNSFSCQRRPQQKRYPEKTLKKKFFMGSKLNGNWDWETGGWDMGKWKK